MHQPISSDQEIAVIQTYMAHRRAKYGIKPPAPKPDSALAIAELKMLLEDCIAFELLAALNPEYMQADFESSPEVVVHYGRYLLRLTNEEAASCDSGSGWTIRDGYGDVKAFALEPAELGDALLAVLEMFDV